MKFLQEYTCAGIHRFSPLVTLRAPVGCLIARSRLISPLNTGLELQFAAPRILPPHRSRNTPCFDAAVAMQMTMFTPLSRPLTFSPPSVSQESELMKSEMQIMTEQLGSTAAADESPQSDKGERNSSVFIFTREIGRAHV